MLQWTQNTGLYDAPLLFTYHQERKKAIHDDTMLITEDLLVLSLSYVSLLCFYAFVYVWFIFARQNLRIWEIYVCVCVCVHACVHACAQLCPTLCNPMDCTPPGYSVQGIFQARKLEWVAISYLLGNMVVPKIHITQLKHWHYNYIHTCTNNDNSIKITTWPTRNLRRYQFKDVLKYEQKCTF